MSHMETIYLPLYNGNQKRIDVYLPNGYTESKKYKVIYFLDGQNLFFDERAAYGTCWGIKDLCDAYSYPFIIVGIYNAELDRLNEYSPFPVTFEPAIKARPQWTKAEGDIFATWVVETLKPYIDSNYSTLQDFASTAVCGSSMGGVMSSYIGAKYKDIFKFVGVFSIASWYNEEAHLNYIAQQKPNLKQYYMIYVGTEETSVQGAEGMNKIYLDNSSNYLHTLEKLGFDNEHISFYLGKGEHHNEEAWSHYVNNFFKVINKVGI